MKLPTLIIASAAMAAGALFATPSTNTYEAVTADWLAGNYSNVYELAQQRFTANSNDLVAAYLMVEWDTSFSGKEAMSNSIMRLVRISDEVTTPAYTNLWAEMRLGWVKYVTDFIPTLTDAQLSEGHAQSLQPGSEMTSDEILEEIDDAGLW